MKTLLISIILAFISATSLIAQIQLKAEFQGDSSLLKSEFSSTKIKETKNTVKPTKSQSTTAYATIQVAPSFTYINTYSQSHKFLKYHAVATSTSNSQLMKMAKGLNAKKVLTLKKSGINYFYFFKN